MTQQRSDYTKKRELEIGTNDDGDGDGERKWVERIGKAAYDLACDRIKSEEYNDFIVKSSDPISLGCLERAIEQYFDSIPSKLKPTFQQMLEDINARKDHKKCY